MKPIQISAIVLSYNGDKRLLPTLESCRAQTYQYKDLVIADDASTDGGRSVAVINKWLEDNAQYFTNVHFISNKTNLGIVQNFRKAALMANGEIIFGIGQGDLYYGPDTFKILANEIRQQREKGLNDPLFWLGFYCSYSLIPSWHKVTHMASLPQHLNMLQLHPQKALTHLLRYGNFIGGSSFIYHKNYFSEDIFPLPNEIRDVEDYPALIYMLANNKKIGQLNMFLRWYEYGTGISTSKKSIEFDLRGRNSSIAVHNWVSQLNSISKHHKKMFETIAEYQQYRSHTSRFLHAPNIFIENLLHRGCSYLNSHNRYSNFLTNIESNSGIPFRADFMSSTNLADNNRGTYL